MMNFRQLSPMLSVSEQLSPEDMTDVKGAGFKTVIINRPDGEGLSQPNHKAIQQAAEMEELKVYYIPIKPGQITDDDINAFAETLKTAPSPALAYCRTGTRSTMLWALSEVENKSTADILSAAQSVGYDLSNIEEQLKHRRLASTANQCS